jgi:hypothetical protein
MPNSTGQIILEDVGSKNHDPELATQVCDQIAEIIKCCATIQSGEVTVKQVITKAKRIVGAIEETPEKQSGLKVFWSQWGTLRRPYR